MNCAECKERLVDYIEGTLDCEASDVAAHLEQCPTCRAELEELQSLCGRLSRPAQQASTRQWDAAVMDRIMVTQATELRRLKMRKQIRIFGLSAAGLAAAACLILFVVLAPTQDQRASAAEVMARAASQASGLNSVHLKCRMRTLPADNFSLVGVAYDFVDIDVWKQFGDPVQYRIEKPGRVLVSDGKSTVMLLKPNIAVKGPAGANFDAGWLRDLADVEKLLTVQLRETLARKGDMTVKHEEVGGKKKLIVTVEVKATNVGEYLRNKFIDTANTRRVFQFDDSTGRLEEMRIFIREKDKDVSVFEVTAIDYDPQLAASTFSLELPKDVAWAGEPTSLPDNEKYTKMTPKEVAKAFFEACGKEDWEEAAKFWPMPLNDQFKKYLGGMTVVKLGEPFQAAPYGGWFVPYEIKLKGGDTRKHNLAVRNDNPGKRYVVDGGL